MGVSETPTCNSVRVQRAYRINYIEQGRLGNRCAVLDKERVRRNRLINQDIRMIRLTLDFIRSSSGQSPEGACHEADGGGDSGELGACFMYGDRQNSRRFGKNRRVQSATTLRERRFSADSASSCSTSPTHQGLFVTRPASVADGRVGEGGVNEKEGGVNEKDSTRTIGQFHPVARPQTATESSQCTSSTAPIPKSRVQSRGKAARPHTAAPKISVPDQDQDAENSGILTTRSTARKQLYESSDKCKSIHARTAEITQAVNEARVKASSARRQHSASVRALWLGPVVSRSPKDNHILESRQKLAFGEASKVDEKVQAFMKKYPAQRHLPE